MYPILSLFGLQIGTYGIFCVLGGTFAILLAMYNTRYTKCNRFDLLEACMFTILGAIVGAKLLYLLVSVKEIHLEIQENGIKRELIGSLLQGGFVFYGGLLGGLFCLFLYARKQEYTFQSYLIAIVPSVPLAHAFGRIGCFMAGCCYGIPFQSPIGICLPYAIGDAPHNIPLFPVQLLESGCNFLLAAILQIFMKRMQCRTKLIAIYFMIYAVIRMITEQFRFDTARGFFLGISTSEWISIGIFLIGFLLWCRILYQNHKKIVMQ